MTTTASSSNYSRLGMSLAVTLVTVGLDWLTKHIILTSVMTPPKSIEVTSFFNVVLVWNKGVSFGMFGSGDFTTVLSLFAAAVTVILIRWLWKTTSTLLSIAISLIIGGAIGNIIDRIRFGAVVDFLDFHALGHHWPAFNVADAAICIGVALIFMDGLREKKL